jgi:hypothetical protein
MPKTLSQVTSLLLFNSSSNPYNLDDFDIQADIEREERRRATALILHEAPKILSLGEDMRFRKQDYNFQPQMADMPKMEFAEALNIAGIASIGWDDEDEDEDDGTNFFGGGFGTPNKPKVQGKAEPGLPSLSQPKGPALPNLGPLPSTTPPLPNLGPAPTAAPPLPSLGPAAKTTAPPPLPGLGPAAKTTASPPLPGLGPAAKTTAPPPLPSLNPAPKANASVPPPLPNLGATPSVEAYKPPPPPKDVELPPPSSDRSALLASIRTENPMSRLRKTPAADSAKGPAKTLSKNPMDLLKEKIAQRNRELNVKTEEVKQPSEKPFPRSMTAVQLKPKGSDSEWSSDSD